MTFHTGTTQHILHAALYLLFFDLLYHTTAAAVSRSPIAADRFTSTAGRHRHRRAPVASPLDAVFVPSNTRDIHTGRALTPAMPSYPEDLACLQTRSYTLAGDMIGRAGSFCSSHFPL